MTQSNPTIDSIEGLVLRKFDYSETSLIFVLLTRQLGQQSFIMKGARKGGKRKFPAVDLFRNVQVECSLKPGRDLQTIRGAELVENFDAIATHPLNYRAAGWLCKFAEKTTVPEEPCDQQYTALKCAFQRLLAPCKTVYPICLGYIFSSLEEHGSLPSLSSLPQHEDALRYMLAYSTDNQLKEPAYTTKQWEDLFFWAINYLRANDFPVPDFAKLR